MTTDATTLDDISVELTADMHAFADTIADALRHEGYATMVTGAELHEAAELAIAPVTVGGEEGNVLISLHRAPGGRVKFRASLPVYISRLYVRNPVPSILVSAARPALHIAREVVRRLLPDVIEYTDVAQNWYAGALAEADGTDKLVGQVLGISGGRMRLTDDPIDIRDRRRQSLSGSFGECWVHADVSVRSTTLELRALSAAQVVAVMRALSSVRVPAPEIRAIDEATPVLEEISAALKAMAEEVGA